jgi:cell division FtsZ-interacting protein ZapD
MIYEKAFNEILRHCLKFEKLILDIEEAKQSQSGINSTLELLLGVIDYLERRDFKTKLLNELYAVEKILSHFQNIASESIRKDLMLGLSDARERLARSAVTSKALLSDPLLSKVYYKHQGVDSLLHQQCWYNQSYSSQLVQVEYWVSVCSSYVHAVQMILHIYRGLSGFVLLNSEGGFYRKSFLDRDLKQIHLVRIKVSSGGYYPLISLTKRWLSVTWYQSQWVDHKFVFEKTKDIIDAEISICSTAHVAQGAE